MFIGVKEAASLLGVSEKSIYRWVSQETMPFYRVGGQYRFRSAELLEWAAGRRMVAAAEGTEFAREEGGRLPSLAEALERGGIHYRVGGKDRESALRSALYAIPVAEDLDREALLGNLLERESLGSTGLGKGVAAPHSRGLILHGTRNSRVALCFLEAPVDFGALDGELVGALFIPLATSMRAHVHLLSRLAFVLRDAEMQRLLQGQASREAILGRVREIEPGPR